jgi:hypothetical protein
MIRRLTVRDLADRLGRSERFWERRRPALRRLGLLTKNGRADFGDIERIAAAVMAGTLEGEMTGTKAAGRPAAEAL